MNKKEILEEINKTKEHLANMEKMLEECENERWKPKYSDRYYYVSEECTAMESRAWAEYIVDERYRRYNVFKTEEEAELEAEKILVRRMLEDIARRLNKGEEIDWSDEGQTKHFIFFDCKTQLIERDGNLRNKIQGVVYCLDMDFCNVAIKEIGEGRLIKYLRDK